MVSNAEVPLSFYSDATYFKVYMADSGLLCRRLGLSYKSYMEENDSLKTIKGAITENYVLCQLKAAANTQAKSYKQFCKKYNVERGFKLSLKNIGMNEIDGVKTFSLPLYLAWNMEFYFCSD